MHLLTSTQGTLVIHHDIWPELKDPLRRKLATKIIFFSPYKHDPKLSPGWRGVTIRDSISTRHNRTQGKAILQFLFTKTSPVTQMEQSPTVRKSEQVSLGVLSRLLTSVQEPMLSGYFSSAVGSSTLGETNLMLSKAGGGSMCQFLNVHWHCFLWSHSPHTFYFRNQIT